MAEQASHTRHMIREVVDDVVGHKIAELERGISSALANAVRRIEEVSEQRGVGRGGAAEEIRRRSSSSTLRAAASLEVPVEERMRDQQVCVTFFTFCLHMSFTSKCHFFYVSTLRRPSCCIRTHCGVNILMRLTKPLIG